MEPEGIGAVYYCATGAYMERELLYWEEDANISSNYPCDEVRDHPAACYRYKLRSAFAQNESEKAAAVCLGLNGAARRGCFHGLGFAYHALVFKNPEFANPLCRHGDQKDQQMCIEGVVGVLIVYNWRIARKACDSLPKELRVFCSNFSKIENFGMKREF